VDSGKISEADAKR
ncbi:hypothetical protein MKD33_20360, partial [Chromobacterium piscinae]